MDLKDVVSNVYAWAGEAHAAFHAGHHVKAEEYLAAIENEVGNYITENPVPASDVTKSATSEEKSEQPEEKPAEVPGAQEWPGAVHSEHAVPPVEHLPESQKPTQ